MVAELRVARPQRPANDARVADAGERGRARVLVVEDDRDMNDHLSQCLGAHYDVYSAFDGARDWRWRCACARR